MTTKPTTLELINARAAEMEAQLAQLNLDDLAAQREAADRMTERQIIIGELRMIKPGSDHLKNDAGNEKPQARKSPRQVKAAAVDAVHGVDATEVAEVARDKGPVIGFAILGILLAGIFSPAISNVIFWWDILAAWRDSTGWITLALFISLPILGGVFAYNRGQKKPKSSTN